MAVLITLAIPMVLIGGTVGTFLTLSFAIRREDRLKWSLRSEPTSFSAQVARALVGINGSRWD